MLTTITGVVLMHVLFFVLRARRSPTWLTCCSVLVTVTCRVLVCLRVRTLLFATLETLLCVPAASSDAGTGNERSSGPAAPAVSAPMAVRPAEPVRTHLRPQVPSFSPSPQLPIPLNISPKSAPQLQLRHSSSRGKLMMAAYAGGEGWDGSGTAANEAPPRR